MEIRVRYGRDDNSVAGSTKFEGVSPSASQKLKYSSTACAKFSLSSFTFSPFERNHIADSQDPAMQNLVFIAVDDGARYSPYNETFGSFDMLLLSKEDE